MATKTERHVWPYKFKAQRGLDGMATRVFPSPTDTGASYQEVLEGDGIPVLHDSAGRPAPFRNLFRGRHLFLMGGGPSLEKLDLGLLDRRGIVTMAMNNAWIMKRPDLWVSVDQPGKFIDTGWKDPGVMKFVPKSSALTRLRFMHGETGKMCWSKFRVCDMPNVWYFTRNNNFNPETFFFEPYVSWGNTKKEGPDSVGVSNARSVMLCAIRLAHYLGFGHVYLIGVDFHMHMDMRRKPYAFGEEKHQKGRATNNRMFEGMNTRLTALQEYMKRTRMPFRVFNCNPKSHLKAFPFMEYGEAVERAGRECGKPVRGEGWYDI